MTGRENPPTGDRSETGTATLPNAMPHSPSTDPTLTNRYLAGQLTPDEERAYELRLTTDPQALRELEATARLKVGLAQRELEALLYAPISRQASSWLRPVPLLALAAALAVVVVGVQTWRHSQPTAALLASRISELPLRTGAATSPALVVTVLRLRSADSDATAALPTTAGPLQLRILPDTPSDARGFRVTLSRTNADGTSTDVASGGPFVAAGDGFITLYVDSARLSPGTWWLALIPVAGGNQQYFRLSLQAPEVASGSVPAS